ncbi:MAG: hypothetical protein U5O16_11805 [Rhodococcus sp. (in: high G+C Gram-positive bacteria)]|uniref:hypothetical protein n=1 Tax=Rhodococcus sp. TaxID=1831 RepID=UPI002ADA0C50|nr:hypothetical protein [Rhodococcus sp. (in: high G+C Gram-positive bacteria)]
MGKIVMAAAPTGNHCGADQLGACRKREEQNRHDPQAWRPQGEDDLLRRGLIADRRIVMRDRECFGHVGVFLEGANERKK